MMYKTLLTISVLVVCLMLLSACGYMKDIKEKMNPNEEQVNVRTEEPASPTDGKVNPPDENSKNNSSSASKGDNSDPASNEKSKETSNPNSSTNTVEPSKGSKNQ